MQLTQLSAVAVQSSMMVNLLMIYTVFNDLMQAVV
jgi:hypothetical protein